MHRGVLHGEAPVDPPKSGFDVDGDLYVDPNTGDWFLNPATISNSSANPGSILYIDVDGKIKPVYTPTPQTTYIMVDGVPAGSAKDPTIFGEKAKIDMDPNNYVWTSGSSPQKNEIEHAFVHFTEGPDTDGDSDSKPDVWMTFSGDRLSNNGDSYIDFEFLQKKLFKNDDGTFSVQTEER